jgi:hypothetical protein
MYPSAALGAPADVFDSALVCVGVFMRNWHIVCVEAIGNHLFEGVPRNEPLPMSATDWQRFTTVRIPKRYHQLNCTQVWAGAKVACGSSRGAHSSANYPNGAPYTNCKGRVYNCPPLRFPPLREGNRVGRVGSVPPACRGNLKEGVIGHTRFCELWLRDWYYAKRKGNARALRKRFGWERGRDARNGDQAGTPRRNLSPESLSHPRSARQWCCSLSKMRTASAGPSLPAG